MTDASIKIGHQKPSVAADADFVQQQMRRAAIYSPVPKRKLTDVFSSLEQIEGRAPAAAKQMRQFLNLRQKGMAKAEDAIAAAIDPRRNVGNEIGRRHYNCSLAAFCRSCTRQQGSAELFIVHCESKHGGLPFRCNACEQSLVGQSRAQVLAHLDHHLSAEKRAIPPRQVKQAEYYSELASLKADFAEVKGTDQPLMRKCGLCSAVVGPNWSRAHDHLKQHGLRRRIAMRMTDEEKSSYNRSSAVDSHDDDDDERLVDDDPDEFDPRSRSQLRAESEQQQRDAAVEALRAVVNGGELVDGALHVEDAESAPLLAALFVQEPLPPDSEE